VGALVRRGAKLIAVPRLALVASRWGRVTRNLLTLLEALERDYRHSIGGD
jgi:hypothetical protein